MLQFLNANFLIVISLVAEHFLQQRGSFACLEGGGGLLSDYQCDQKIEKNRPNLGKVAKTVVETKMLKYKHNIFESLKQTTVSHALS